MKTSSMQELETEHGICWDWDAWIGTYLLPRDIAVEEDAKDFARWARQAAEDAWIGWYGEPREEEKTEDFLRLLDCIGECILDELRLEVGREIGLTGWLALIDEDVAPICQMLYRAMVTHDIDDDQLLCVVQDILDTDLDMDGIIYELFQKKILKKADSSELALVLQDALIERLPDVEPQKDWDFKRV